MKILLASILALSLLPFASVAGDVEIGSEDRASQHIKPGENKSKTSHENSKDDDDDYPPEGNEI